MNSYGRIFRVTIWGESHGPGLGVSIDGVPPGLALSRDDFVADLDRRRPGRKGTTTRKERDIPVIQSGLFEGHTTGSPLTLLLENKDVRSSSYAAIRHTPRPGHADFVAHKKYGGFADYRGGGHFSGRLTAALVAAGVVAKKLIQPAHVHAEIVEIGGRSDQFDAAVDEAMAQKDSIGGIVECRVSGVPVGWGEPFFDSVESTIAHAVFAIPGIKGIEFGAGFETARMTGSQCNDSIVDGQGHTASNHAGGINGGITNGNQLRMRVAVRPTPSIGREQQTINIQTGQSSPISVGGRHDACIALRVPPVLEAAVALALADFYLLSGK